MRIRIGSTAGAGSATVALGVVLWLAVQAGTAGGETPFPVSDWAGPSYSRDGRSPAAPPLTDAVTADAQRDRAALAAPAPRSGDDDIPRPAPPDSSPLPSPQPTPTRIPSPQPTHSVTPTPSPSPTDTPSPPERYSMDVAITASASRPAPGEAIRYTIRVRNTGTETLRNITAQSHVPDGTVRAECTGSGPFSVCTQSNEDETGHIDTWVGTLGPGETFTYTMDVVVRSSTKAGTKIRNHAHAHSQETGRVTSPTVTSVVR